MQKFTKNGWIEVAPTVEELIEELKQFNPKAKVRMHISILKNDKECAVSNEDVIAYRDVSCASYRHKTKEERDKSPYIDIWDTDIVEIHSKGII